MEIEVTQRQYYGRTGELNKLKAQMEDTDLPYRKRKVAAKTYWRIIQQCNDVKLMEYRQRLIRAAQAGDRYWIGKISYQMKQYLGEDAESGIYET